MHSLKTSMTLPLQKPQQHATATDSTPDLMLSLGLLTPVSTAALHRAAAVTPADLLMTPTSFLNPAFVTEEQESFVMNFDQKLQHLMSSQQLQQYHDRQLESKQLAYNLDTEPLQSPPSVEDLADEILDNEDSSNDAEGAYRFVDASDVSGESASTSSDLQLLRLERKRRRNREAARRCRERKLDRLRVLDERAGVLRARNAELRRTAERLRAQLAVLQASGLQTASERQAEGRLLSPVTCR